MTTNDTTTNSTTTSNEIPNEKPSRNAKPIGPSGTIGLGGTIGTETSGVQSSGAKLARTQPTGSKPTGTRPVARNAAMDAAIRACADLGPDEAHALLQMLSERASPNAAFEASVYEPATHETTVFEAMFPHVARRLDLDDGLEDRRRDRTASLVSEALGLARAVRRAGAAALARDPGPCWGLCARLAEAHRRLGVLADAGDATAALVLDHIEPVVAECYARAIEAAHAVDATCLSNGGQAVNGQGAGSATALRLVTKGDRS